MSKEGQFIAYTGEEANANRLWEATRDEFMEAFHAITDRLAGQPDMREPIDHLETRFNAVQVEWTHVLHARLVRVLPHLADAITYLYFPEFMGMPSWVDERGLPHAWTQPHGGGDVDDEMDHRERRRAAERRASEAALARAEGLSAAMRAVGGQP